MRIERLGPGHLRYTLNSGVVKDICGDTTTLNGIEADLRAIAADVGVPGAANPTVPLVALTCNSTGQLQHTSAHPQPYNHAALSALAALLAPPPPFEPLLPPVMTFNEEPPPKPHVYREFHGPAADLAYSTGLLQEALLLPPPPTFEDRDTRNQATAGRHGRAGGQRPGTCQQSNAAGHSGGDPTVLLPPPPCM